MTVNEKEFQKETEKERPVGLRGTRKVVFGNQR